MEPDVKRPRLINKLLYRIGKRFYGTKAKLVISPFVSFTGKTKGEVCQYIEDYAKLGLFESK